MSDKDSASPEPEGEGHEEDNRIKILEFAYETLQKYSFQSVISTYEELLSEEINEENGNRLTFEILSKPEGESGEESVTRFVDVPNIKEIIEELITDLKVLGKKDVEDKKDWQMDLTIPLLNKHQEGEGEADNTINNWDQIETRLNTDSIFSLLAAQSWIERYKDEHRTYLFHRSE